MSIDINRVIPPSQLPLPGAVRLPAQQQASASDVPTGGSHAINVPALPRQRRERWQRIQLTAALVLDLAAVLGTFVAGTALRGSPDVPLDRLGCAVALSLAWLTLTAVNGGYDLRSMGTGVPSHKQVLNAGLHLVAAVGLATTLPEWHDLRTLLPTVALVPVLVLVSRYASHLALSAARRRGYAVRRVLVIGEPSAAFPLASRLEKARGAGLVVVGVCSPTGVDRRAGRLASGRSERRRNAPPLVLGTLESAALLARREAVDIVAVAHSPGMNHEALRVLSWQLEESNVEMLVAPALADVAGPRISVEPVAGLPLLHIAKPEFTATRRLIKGTGDRVLALGGILALSPLLLLVVLMIRLDSSGPVFFRQQRIGQGGRVFHMLKFRSMHVDAEARLAEISLLNQHVGDPMFKMKDDPRVTRVGRHLRRWSIDELPQLLNVLRGEMSLVGPRPPLPQEVAAYDQPSVFRRLMVKPGLTGLWQVSGRSDLSWQESVRLDLYYVENWSPALDASILWRTLGAVTRGSGAY